MAFALSTLAWQKSEMLQIHRTERLFIPLSKKVKVSINQVNKHSKRMKAMRKRNAPNDPDLKE